MSNFSITIDRCRTSADGIYKVSSAISSLNSGIQNVENALNSRLFLSLKMQLKSEMNEINNISYNIRDSSERLKEVIELYLRTESNLLGEYKNKVKTDAQISPAIVLPEDLGDQTRRCLSDANDLNDYFSNIAKIVSFYLDSHDNEKGSAVADIVDDLFSWFAALGSMSIPGCRLPVPSVVNWLDLVKSGLKIDKSILALYEKYGDKVGDLSALTYAANGIGIISSWMKNYYKSGGYNSDFFRNTSGITSAISKFVKGPIYKSQGLEGIDKYVADVEKAGPVMALINMGLYAVADGIEKFQDGTDAAEISQFLEGVGITGANTLISSVTLGIVNLETSDVLNNFKEAEDFTNDLLNGLGITGWRRGVVAVTSSIPIAAYGVGKSIFDFGYSIGDKIMSLF